MANARIEIEYNQSLTPLVKVLSRVERPGDFYTNGSLVAPMPRLEIEGVGIVAFPVPATQGRDIVSQAQQAPYGRGEQTLVDPAVRKVWQVSPDKVRLGGASWPQTLETILARVVAGLGCQGVRVSAEFYKLLVYDVGAFFVAHRDTEKARGMFGTLVIVLPSLHRGGELVVRHAGREMVLDLRTRDVAEINYAAFYADCEHEVRPVTEGYRLCLIYNLIQRSRRPGKTQALAAPDYEAEIAKATTILKKWATASDESPKLVYLLEHQYSPAGLSFSGLKNADAAMGQVLAKAAQRAGCVMHLGILHIEEEGPAEITYQPYSYYEEEEETEEFEVVEVSNARHYVDNWVDVRDRAVDFGQIPLQAGELLPEGTLDDETPDEQRVMEATGNEGASFERSYHRAAIILWPEDKYPEVLLQGGAGSVIPYFQEKVRNRSREEPQSKRELAALARRIINAWEPSATYSYYGDIQQEENKPDRNVMLQTLTELGDPQLVERFLQQVVVRHYDGSENEALVACSHVLDANRAFGLLSTLIGRNMRFFGPACVGLFKRLVHEYGRNPSPEVAAGQQQIAQAIVQGLEKVGRAILGYGEPSSWRAQESKPVDGRVLFDLFEALRAAKAMELAEEVAAILIGRPKVFVPDLVLIPTLGLLREQHGEAILKEPAFIELWREAADFLLARSERPPVPPTDWAQKTRWSCHCPDCQALQAFARAPEQRVARFPLRKDRRQHLHRIIESHGLDMTHETERIGSPQTLVCTKTRRTYQNQQAQYRKDIAAFRTLAGMMSGSPPRALRGLLSKIHEAIGRARE